MNFKIIKINDYNNIPFKNLQQLYEFEFSLITGYLTNEEGLYEQKTLVSHWSKKHDIYLLYNDKRPIGFSVVNLESLISYTNDTRDIAEFFILPDMRKNGIGSWFAIQIFKTYPGKWEIRQLPELKVKNFWLKIIQEFTNNNYLSLDMNNKIWTGSVQKFFS